jgi:two-component system chemotaxis sensor kinase CheA
MPIDPKLLQKLRESFKDELRELHHSMIEILLSLEKARSVDKLNEDLKTLFRYSHNMKGAAKSVGIDSISAIAHCLENVFSEWREQHLIPTKAEVNACLEVTDNTILALNDFSNGMLLDVEHYLQPLRGESSQTHHTDEINSREIIKLPLEQVEQANAKANDFITHQLKLANWIKGIELQVHQLDENNSNLTNANLSKNLTAILSDGGQLLGDFSRSLQALQDELKAMQMLPISYVLTPLERTVRDLASSLNKSIELHIEGGDIELDKSIIDAIKDPLQHLVRNAIDHGIESNERRKELNKPIPASILIQVYHRSGNVNLKITDDGQGIDIEKIKKCALQKSIYTEEELKNLNDNQILDIIFQSGFSTQDHVTELSGRGVGLDAVSSDIQKIKGHLSVESTLGIGTNFNLILPLTLATSRGVFVKVNEHTFMFPTISLNSLFEINMHHLKWVDNECVMIVNETPIPIQVLSHILNNNSPPLDTKKTYYGLLMGTHNKQLILLVDSILDEHECVVKSLPFPLSKLEQYIGTTLSGNEDLILVLDPSILMQVAYNKKTSWLDPNVNPLEENELKKRVLIVDDSLTTRTLCSSALDAAGYETSTSTDGKKAWQILQEETFDCIVTDIMMPELSGFELTRLIKNSKKHYQTPVIIVSSLQSEQDQKEGLEAGANAYLIKSEFDTHSLIETIESLI